ncbi:hypothetical protein [Salimicrobium flavidum]|uniref:YceG-like family protein n=1 Tax=Salimicrobium flavidum TaxID=570947 RepID=A0A1N7IIK6_9BACI|nr:hypothetical protein [Salimicrobium flavidum]SIS36880.1 hypothetical protein SAMN05421687_101116 [Salimicrobium flavidum]
MRPVLQAFASGLLAATLLLGVVYYTGNADAKVEKETNEPATEEMIAKLKDDDYVIHTEKEWKQLQTQEEKEQSNSTPDSYIRTYEITVSQGMSSRDISKKLEKASIIEDALTFNDYLIENGFSKKIQTGNFLVDDRMDRSELAETLTSE